MKTSLIDTIPLPIMIIGPDLTVSAANMALQDILGTHVVGRHFTAALRQPMLVMAVETALTTGIATQSELRLQDHAADLRFDVTIEPCGTDVILSLLDRTAAFEVSQFRTDFVANVSHELRTPLTALLGFIETLRGPARDDDAARDRFLGIMESEAVRMTRLVDDLLSLSRVEEEERIRPNETLMLGELVRSAIAGLNPMVTAADATLSFLDESEGQTILGDPRQLHQVLSNLIENALKYGDPQGQISIRLAPVFYAAILQGRAVSISVQDTGPGIPDHHIPRLTERFYRLDDHRSRDLGGTGLGLAIVKHIVNRHRGRLTIHSEIGKGTTVTVTLPV